MAAADVGIRLADHRRTNSDQDLARLWFRLRDLGDAQDLGRPVSILDDGSHAATVRLSLSGG
jgi:hypothetical protein